jgi:hypothetical protein
MTVTVWLDLWRKSVVVRRRFVPIDHADGHDQPSATERYLGHCRWLDAAARDHGGASHPVVRIAQRDPERLVIATLFAGAATAFSRPLPPTTSAQLLTATANALAKLHACGLVHGNLTGDHILLRGSHFSLCSPTGLGAGFGAEPADDVAAFGPLIDGLLWLWDEDDEGQPRFTIGSSERRRWEELAHLARHGSLSAARLAMRLETLQQPMPHRVWRLGGRRTHPGSWRYRGQGL